MLELIGPVLAGGVKGFLEDPELLIGVPLIAIGIMGVMLILTPVELKWPQPAGEPEPVELIEAPEGHPTATVYVQVGLALAFVTGLEVALYYVDIAQGLLAGLLLALSALKFVVVALWFMHLRFDNRLFTVLFAGGIALAVALLAVVLATLGASLV